MMKVLVTLLTLASLTQADLYTSLHHVDQLFLFDQRVSLMLIVISPNNYYCSQYLESYSGVIYDVAHYGGNLLGDKVAGNPLHIYHLFKRFVRFWPGVKDEFNNYISDETKNEADKNIIKDVLKGAEALTIPIEDDLEGAAAALARLVRTYRIREDDFCQGNIYGVQSRATLDFDDCMLIGDMSAREGFIANGILWFNQCADLAEGDQQLLMAETQIEEMTELHDEHWEDNDSHYFPKLLSEDSNQVTWDEIFYQLCRGLDLLGEGVRKTLTCYRSHQGSSFLRLQPVKVEVLLQQPKIVLFHDVISDQEIEELKKLSLDKLTRSATLRKEKDEVRVSMTSWVSERDNEVVKRLSKRVSYVTGLHTYEGPYHDMAGESLQVLSYGIGGHYGQHYDYFFKDKPENEWHLEADDRRIPGDRLATWMFYLSDVAMGGGTAFMRSNVATVPTKGAAVFWYNLNPDGSGNHGSEHGGCPVLLGRKWAANKWMREHANFRKYPCPINYL